MSHSSTPAASAAATTPPPSAGSLADLTAHNEARALTDQAASVTASRRRINLAKRLGIPLAVVVAGGTVLIPAEAEARVLPVTTVTAHLGPIVTPAGQTRCKGRGDYHFAVKVHTTTKDADGHAHAAVWIQETRKGRSVLAGFAKSSTSTVAVIGCVNPGRVDGGSGPIYGIASDAVDTNTRSFLIRLGR